MLDELVWTENSTTRNSDNSISGPAKLTKLAGDIVNEIPLPKCWHWQTDQVIHWLNFTVKLPQYKDCFERNFINGRRLLLLEDDSLPKIGICDYSHIKIVMKEIRYLSGFEPIDWNKSVSLPPRQPLTLYLQYRIPTGPIREATSPVDYFKKINILNNYKCCSDESPNHLHEFPCTRFGFIKRKNVYDRIEFKRPNLNQITRVFNDPFTK